MNEDCTAEMAHLKSTINRFLDDTKCPFIKKKVIFPYGDMRPEKFQFLRNLEERGIARILGDPWTLDADDDLIEMLKYIDQNSPIPGFLNNS